MFRVTGLFFLVWIVAIVGIANVGAQDGGRSLWTETARVQVQGSRTIIDASVGAINYKAPWKGINEWTPITPNWVSASPPWNYESIGVEYDVRVLRDISAGQIIEWEVDGSTLTFQPMALNWVNSLGQIDQISMPDSSAVFSLIDRAAMWRDAYGPGLDLGWKLQNTFLSKELTISTFDSLPEPASYILAEDTPQLELDFIFAFSNDLTLFVDGMEWSRSGSVTTGKDVLFQKAGIDLFRFKTPFAYDSLGELVEGEIELKKQGNSLFINARIPYAWLLNATYPVVFDPTLDVQISSGFNDAHETDDNTAFVSTSTLERAYASTAGAARYNAGYRFTGIIIAGKQIDVAYMTIFADSTARDDPHVDIYAEAVDISPNFVVSPDVTTRGLTVSSVSWSAIGIGIGANNTPSLVVPVQEIANRPGHDNDSLTIFLRGKADLVQLLSTETFNGTPGEAAAIHIEFSDLAPTPTLVPDVTRVTFEGGVGLASVIYVVLLLGFIFVGFAFNAGFFFIASIFVLIPLSLNLDNMFFYILTAGLASILIWGTVHSMKDEG